MVSVHTRFPAQLRRIFLLSIIFIAVGSLIFPLFLHAERISIAVLPLENSTGDASSDYLGRIAEAVLMFDLSSQEEVDLVSRGELDAVLQEQRLALSGLVAESSELREIGGLTGADYLIKGEYVHLGDDILFIMKLISVESGEVELIRERGTDENTVHRISSELLRSLRGSAPSLVTEEGSRSIISMKNEEPGSIALFSPLIDARIFLDGEFVGYTTGKATEPYLIEGVRPGPHSIRTHLSRNFGVVTLPEIEFGDWCEDIRVRPRSRIVVRDKSRHFNGILYDLKWLVREDFDFQSFEELSGLRKVLPFDFIDRMGVGHRGRIELRAGKMPEEIELLLEMDEEEHTKRLSVPTDAGSASEQIALELVSLELEIEYRYGSYELEMELTRNDVYQGLHREEYR